jgi:hypothetical protein
VKTAFTIAVVGMLISGELFVFLKSDHYFASGPTPLAVTLSAAFFGLFSLLFIGVSALWAILEYKRRKSERDPN